MLCDANRRVARCDGKSPGAGKTVAEQAAMVVVFGCSGQADVTKLACRSDDRSLAQQAGKGAMMWPLKQARNGGGKPRQRQGPRQTKASVRREREVVER